MNAQTIITENADLLFSLKLQAQRDMARWPQYAGHFDGYRLCRVKRRIKTKMGLAFEKGEIAIFKDGRASDGVDDGIAVVVYSASNRCDTGVFAKDVEVLG